MLTLDFRFFNKQIDQPKCQRKQYLPIAQRNNCNAKLLHFFFEEFITIFFKAA